MQMSDGWQETEMHVVGEDNKMKNNILFYWHVHLIEGIWYYTKITIFFLKYIYSEIQ